MKIKDKVIIVTGASSGIGLAISRELAKNGAKVVLAARTARDLDIAAKEIPESLAVVADLRKQEDIEKIVQKTVEKFSRVDILVNNAAQAMFTPVEKINLGKYRELVELNMYAPLSLLQKVVPLMRKQGGGTIINISSQASTKYIPNIAGYASTKFALNSLMLTARQELKKDNIVVSIIRPGLVNTDFGGHTENPEPDALRNAPDGSLLPHVIQPETVAEKVVELIHSGEAELNL